MNEDDPGGGVAGPSTLHDARNRARQLLGQLSQAERESIIIKCWMSHDARWFAAVAMTVGLEAAQRLNKLAVREEGKAEARRLVRRLGIPPVLTAKDFLLFQETAIGLLGPELLDYTVAMHDRDGFDLHVQRCFAFDQVSRAGIAAEYECGIIPRLEGWLDELGVECQLTPEPARCLKAMGRDCVYSFANVRPRVGRDRTA